MSARQSAATRRPSTATAKVVAVTGAFSSPISRSRMRGHARVYGERRTLDDAHLDVLLKRLFSIRPWSIG
jgi:hypothetical protein